MTLKILFDGYASEIGWTLKGESDDDMLVTVPFGTYADGRTRATRTFFLQPGKEYSFLIEDSYRDGLSSGNYMFTAAGYAGKGKRLLLFGKGNFGAMARHVFEIPAMDSDVQAEDENEIMTSLQSQVGILSLGITLQLDSNPSETGWILERVGFQTEVVASRPPGSYILPSQEITLSVDLEEDELYRFTLLDAKANGMKGRVRLFLDKHPIDGNSGAPIYDYDGSSVSSSSHFVFLASIQDATDSLSPQSTPDNGNEFVTLEMKMDLYPEEIGFQLRADTLVGAVAVEKRASDVVFYRSPGFYAGRTNEIVREKIMLPALGTKSLQHYSLVVIDAFGDGLCCQWQGRLDNTGYTLYRGDPAQGVVITASSFTLAAREVYSFNIVQDLGQQSETLQTGNIIPASILPMGEVVIRAIVYLDSFPEQTGYSIVDADGRSIVNVPPGSYGNENTVVVENHVLSPGIYTLSIVDSFGDGIHQQSTSVAYEILLEDNLNGPAVVAGDGSFQSRRNHVFVLEGKDAAVPVLIKIDGEDAKMAEYGFQLTRLDLAEADSIVAMAIPGHPSSSGGSLTESLAVQDGGLYCLTVLGPSNEAFAGTTRIAVGSLKNFLEVDINQQPKFLTGLNKAIISIGLVAEKDSLFLSLSIPHQLTSMQLDWVILSLELESWGNERMAYTKRTVIAYGSTQEKQPQAFQNIIEKIPLVSLDSTTQTFMLIVTHALGRMPFTETVGAGTIQVYQGPPEDNVVLVATSLEGESRVVETFSLVVNEAENAATLYASFAGTAVLAGVLFVICAFVVYKMYKK